MSDNAVLVVAWVIAAIVVFASAYLHLPSKSTLERISARPNVTPSTKQP